MSNDKTKFKKLYQRLKCNQKFMFGFSKPYFIFWRSITGKFEISDVFLEYITGEGNIAESFLTINFGDMGSEIKKKCRLQNNVIQPTRGPPLKAWNNTRLWLAQIWLFLQNDRRRWVIACTQDRRAPSWLYVEFVFKFYSRIR